MKLRDLFEVKEKNLIGLEIGPNKIMITPESKNEKWVDFKCQRLGLTSLEGCPQSIERHFNCEFNNLKDLISGPQDVGSTYDCRNNELISLEGAPTTIKDTFNCAYNLLTSLKHAPAEIGSGNDNSGFYCQKNNLTSLKDIHKIIKKINGEFFAVQNPIKSHVLGLLLIEGLRLVTLYDHAGDYPDELNKVDKILNKYLPNTRGHKAVAECEDELIEADLDEYAQL